MTLTEKLKKLYPVLSDEDLDPIFGSIKLQNDGNGDYIREWKHPTLPEPTPEALSGITP